MTRRAVLLILALLLALPAGARAQGPAVDAAARALASDPVYVAPDARPTLTPTQADRLRHVIRTTRPGPVSIAILPGSAANAAGGDPAQVLVQLHDRLARPGTYAVVVGGRFRAGSTSGVLDEGVAAELATQAFDAHQQQGLEPVLEDFVRRVADARAHGGRPAGSGSGSSSGGTVLTVIVLVLLVGGGLLLVSRRRRARREQDERMEELRRFARDDLVALGDDVRAIDVDVDMPGADPAAKRDLALALERYDQAERGFDAARRPEDFEPVTRALEEGRWAAASARARIEGREPPERRPPCFFDPRHGPSTRDVLWAPDGGEPRPVPACEADALRVEEGRDPAAREVVVGGRSMPYWNAPGYYGGWAGGYFGGVGGAFGGFLPGLLFGELLGGGLGGGMGPAGWDGGGWGDGGDGGDGGGGDFGGGDFGGGGDFDGGGDFGGGGDF